MEQTSPNAQDAAAVPLISLRSKFETTMLVRPDDIDMNQHVHNSRYFDYVLAARYDQMARCYGMPMETFIQHGFGWVVKATSIQFKRPLGLGDWITVRTWIDEIVRDGVKVQFQILRRATGKLCADGYCAYTMISLATGRGETIPEWIWTKYAI